MYRLDKNAPDRSLVQKRLSIYNWNPGPRRGKEDAFEKQIASKSNVIPLSNRFHVNHYGGCAILYNLDTFYPRINVKSSYLNDTGAMCLNKWWTEAKDGLCKGAFTCLYFVDLLFGGQKNFHNNYTARKCFLINSRGPKNRIRIM